MRNHKRMNDIDTHETLRARNPMGAAKTEGFKLSFDRRLTLEFHGSNISSDAGLFVLLCIALRRHKQHPKADNN